VSSKPRLPKKGRRSGAQPLGDHRYYCIIYETVNKPSTESALTNLKSMMDGFIKSGKHVYLVLNIPVGLGLDPRARAYWLGKSPVSLNRSEVVTALEPIDSKLRKISLEVGATVINPLDYLCQERVKSCPLGSP
jgi:SGNH domain (fused to AT3 domains)